jgi:adenylosuccinate synthase
MKKIVLGLGFGDEGKGLTVDWICSELEKKNVNVTNVRFSGGPQCGHTVYSDNENIQKHIFSTFGSGSLRSNVRTFVDKTAYFDPICMMNEYKVLLNKGISPLLFVHPFTPVITPYEVYTNQHDEDTLEHGSCGKGICATFMREKNNYHIYAKDLYYPRVLMLKLTNLMKYYGFGVKLEQFFECIKDINTTFSVYPMLGEKGYVEVYEGSQGLLLDQTHGFFPNVTPSNTGLQNIDTDDESSEIFLVTRAYQTRHGNGLMTNEDLPHNIKDNPYESNDNNKYQGEFRQSILDIDLLKYGNYAHGLHTKYCHLVVTCMDLVENAWSYTKNGEVIHCTSSNEFVKSIAKELYIRGDIYVSYGPKATDIRKL